MTLVRSRRGARAHLFSHVLTHLHSPSPSLLSVLPACSTLLTSSVLFSPPGKAGRLPPCSSFLLACLLPSTFQTAADSVAILFSGVCPSHSPHGPPPCLAWPVFSVSGAGMPCPCAVPSSYLEKSQVVVEDFPPQRLAREVTSLHAICFRPSAVPAAPSSWSLDSGAREAQPFLSAHTGCILAPPVPPRSLLHGKKTSSGSPR